MRREKKLYGRLGEMEYEKKTEWCFVLSGEPTVFYEYEITTHFEASESQKDFWIALYSGNELVAKRPVKVEEGKNTQVTSLEFGCTKDDFTFDYANFRATVENLYLTAMSNVTLDGELTGVVFNDLDEMVEMDVVYEQKPDVRITQVEVQSPSFVGDDALVGYTVQANTTGTLFMESVRLVTEGKNWEKDTHQEITDLLSDDGLVSDYGILRIYNYETLNNPVGLSSLTGYFVIKGPDFAITGSNYIQFTSNGKYINGARIVEGKRGGSAARSMFGEEDFHTEGERIVGKDLILRDVNNTKVSNSEIPKRWKDVPILKR